MLNKLYKHILSKAMLFSLLLLLTACSNETIVEENEASSSIDNNKSTATESTDTINKLQIVTSLYPQYDFVKAIAKDKAEVTLLLPPGVESHSFEPTPKDITIVKNANIFIYTNDYMEPWAEKVLEAANSAQLLAINASAGIDFMDGEEEHHDEEEHADEDEHHDEEEHADEDEHHDEEEHADEDEHHDEEEHADEEEHHDEDEHNHGEKDPHVWLDPVLAITMVDNITDGLIKADPENADFYRENAEALKKELQQLDKDFEAAFEKVTHRTIMFGGHFAFGYFAKRYDLSVVSPYEGFAPNAEPSPRKITELIDQVKETGIKTIFYEELVNPKVAEVISKEAGANMLLLHGVHNVSKDEVENGITYIEIMRGNLERLKEGLGYNE
jgi:zinc transport system substrate-binding protein